MSRLTAGPHELEWWAILEEFFGGHEHLWLMNWDTNTMECAGSGCPSRVLENE